MSAAAGFRDRFQIVGVETWGVLEDRSCDLDVVARQALDHQPWCRRIAGETCCEGCALSSIDGVDEPQRQLGVVSFVFGRVCRPLQVEVGEHPQQCRSHVDPIRVTGQNLQACRCRQ